MHDRIHGWMAITHESYLWYFVVRRSACSALAHCRDRHPHIGMMVHSTRQIRTLTGEVANVRPKRSSELEPDLRFQTGAKRSGQVN